MRKETSTTEEGFLEYRRQLEGLGELIEIARDINDTVDPSLRHRNASLDTDSSSHAFTHTRTLSEAIDLCQNGWAEGRQRIKEALSRLESDELANLGTQIEFSIDVAGDEPDIGRYLAGEPEDMIEFFLQPNTRGRNVKLVVNASQHAFVSADAITRRGVAIAAVLEAMSTAGFGIALEVVERCESSGYSKTAVEYRIPIIKAGEYFNIDSLAFALTHPSFLRRLLFTLNESESSDLRDDMGYWNGRGYGRPRDPELRPEEGAAILIGKGEGLLDRDSEIVPYAVKLAKMLIEAAQQE